MTSWGLVLAVCSPLTYFTDNARYSFSGEHFFPVTRNILVAAVFALIFTIGTMVLHKRTMPRRM